MKTGRGRYRKARSGRLSQSDAKRGAARPGRASQSQAKRGKAKGRQASGHGSSRSQPKRGSAKLGREQILRVIAETLEPLGYVYAVWEGGAIGHDRMDKWSDIDLYVDVEDTKIEKALSQVETALDSLSPIELKYEVPAVPGQGYAHAFYRLKGTSEFLLIDLAVFRHSCEDKFLESEIHGKVYFLFNKNDALKCVSLDKKKLLGNLKSSLARIQRRFDTFACFVQKEINRKNWIEALDLYRGLVLDSLVEVLRIQNKPEHHQFRTRYIHYDLPPDIVRRLKALYFVKDEKELKQKYRLAERWFRDALREVDFAEIRRRLLV